MIDTLVVDCEAVSARVKSAHMMKFEMRFRAKQIWRWIGNVSNKFHYYNGVWHVSGGKVCVNCVSDGADVPQRVELGIIRKRNSASRNVPLEQRFQRIHQVDVRSAR